MMTPLDLNEGVKGQIQHLQQEIPQSCGQRPNSDFDKTIHRP